MITNGPKVSGLCKVKKNGRYSVVKQKAPRELRNCFRKDFGLGEEESNFLSKNRLLNDLKVCDPKDLR